MTASRTKIFHPLNEFFLMTRRTCSMMTMTMIIDKLQLLRCELAKHFPDISRDDLACVRNTYLVASTDLVSIFNGVVDNPDKFIALST